MIFTKEDMLYTYSWKNDVDSGIFTGSASRRLFDRFNGDQVLYIINMFVTPGPDYKTEGQKLEDLIKNWLPSDVKSEVSVIKWFAETGIERP